MMKRALYIVALLFVCVGASVARQDRRDETKSEIPELADFHSVIYKLWHTAWPEKDVAMLKSLWPEIERGFTRLLDARLPAILHDKKEAWEKSLAEFAASVKEYQRAMEGSDTEAFLKAAEKLHAQYELLVRTVKPPLQEIDSFHQSLYMLYHHYGPEYDYRRITQSVIELEGKMVSLNQVKLPDRHREKEVRFLNARKDLGESLTNLSNIIAANKGKDAILVAIERMHSNYEALERVFE
ncbi:MAG TPA: hypothetical protein DCP63_00735 [Bacteroidetes bacterium]|nr:hypothetical protein [Bacteroidota bacterium]